MADRDALIQAALESLGWPDDRAESAHVEPDGHVVSPLGAYWDTVAELVDGVLTGVYWHLRDHADGYRAASPTSDAASHRLHGWYARGIEAGARDLAGLLGVEECEIERPEPAGGTR